MNTNNTSILYVDFDALAKYRPCANGLARAKLCTTNYLPQMVREYLWGTDISWYLTKVAGLDWKLLYWQLTDYLRYNVYKGLQSYFNSSYASLVLVGQLYDSLYGETP